MDVRINGYAYRLEGGPILGYWNMKYLDEKL